jgi:hypothetical protein
MARIAKTVKNDLSTLKQSCVGKKMKGFKFADCKSASWVPPLQDFIGQEGKIIGYNEAWNYFKVKFNGDGRNWNYPATKALKHIVEESKESYVGKKIKGFKFTDTSIHTYATDMNKFIGKIGKIEEYNEGADEFRVHFKGDFWYYPATEALKHIVEEPKVSDEDLVTVQEIIDETYTAMLKADIEDLSTKLDQAYREQEDMLEELRQWINAFPGAFAKLIKHAGQITEEDVNYHTGIVLRVMEHKFGYKSKTEE